MQLQKSLRWVVLCISVGLTVGLSCSAFLYSLNWVWRFQVSHHETIFLLPVVALVLTFFFQKFASHFSDPSRLIIEEIHDPKRVLPIMVAPFVFIGSLVSHFAGASTGREGAAVQISVSITDQLSRYLRMDISERKNLLIAGTGAAFGVAIGAPIAGIFFGMEMVYIGKLKIIAFFECVLVSYIAFEVSRFLNIPHYALPRPSGVDFDFMHFVWIAVAGLVFGLVARVFILTLHSIQHQVKKLKLALVWKNLTGAILLSALFFIESSFHYCSLGLFEIEKALSAKVSIAMPILKFAFTILSISSGMKGGEFTPLVFIGSSLGSALSEWIPVGAPVLASLGFAAVFAGAAQVPFTCVILSCELFGWQLAPYAIIACFLSYYVSGGASIYNGQKILQSKHSALFEYFELLKRLGLKLVKKSV